MSDVLFEGSYGVCVRSDSRVEAADLVGLLFGGDVLHFSMIERCDLIRRLWVVLCDDCLMSFLEETCVYIPHPQPSTSQDHPSFCASGQRDRFHCSD